MSAAVTKGNVVESRVRNVMKAVKTPVEALEYAMARGGYPSLVSSRRFKKYQGRPGEIIEKLDSETRSLLQELRSDDISSEKVDRLAAWFGCDDDEHRASEYYHDLCTKFDQKILKLSSREKKNV